MIIFLFDRPTQPGMLVATVTCAQRKGSIIGGVPDEEGMFKVICKVRKTSEHKRIQIIRRNGKFHLFTKPVRAP